MPNQMPARFQIRQLRLLALPLLDAIFAERANTCIVSRTNRRLRNSFRRGHEHNLLRISPRALRRASYTLSNALDIFRDAGCRTSHVLHFITENFPPFICAARSEPNSQLDMLDWRSLCLLAANWLCSKESTAPANAHSSICSLAPCKPAVSRTPPSDFLATRAFSAVWPPGI